MNKEITLTKVDPQEFGLDTEKAMTIEKSFMPMIEERKKLEAEYKELVKAEISPKLCNDADSLRKNLVKVRTGIAAIHKTQKAFFLSAGRFVDAWKNVETLPVEQMEDKLSEIAKHYENIEKQRIADLEENRENELKSFGVEYLPAGLGLMDDNVWINYMAGVKEQKRLSEIAAKEAEQKRIEEEKIEAKRIEDQRLENIRLKKEAEENRKKEEAAQKERDRLAKAHADKLEKERNEREAKELAERQERDRLAKIEKEKQDKISAAKDKAIQEAREEAARLKAIADKKAIEDAQEQARAKDAKHKSKIRNDIYKSLVGYCGESIALDIAKAIIEGKIPNVKIQY